MRRIFLELGRRLHALDVLDDPRDVLYLEVDEVLAFVDGTSTCTNLRSLAALRKAEFRGYQAMDAPDDRFETRGAVYQGHDFRQPRTMAAADGGEERRGVGCSPGVVRGRVRVVTDPNAADMSERAILVAEHTDPGWIMLFPSALAVLVERGSLLSHAAIVARELGIPAVVSVPGLTRWLQDGETVEMDGTTGVIRRIDVTDRGGGRPLCVARSPRSPTSATSATRRCGRTPTSCSADSTFGPVTSAVSIASAGDNTLALLTREPSRVIALDLSCAQLACLELRVAAYRAAHARRAAGAGRLAPLDAPRRVICVAAGRARSGARARSGTRGQSTSLNGIGGAGKFERYFALFRRRVLPLVHRRETVAGAARSRRRSASASVSMTTSGTRGAGG